MFSKALRVVSSVSLAVVGSSRVARNPEEVVGALWEAENLCLYCFDFYANALRHPSSSGSRGVKSRLF